MLGGLPNAGATAVGTLLMLAIPCAGKTQRNHGRDATPSGSSLEDYAAWDVARRRAVCEREVRCGEYSTVEGCEDSIRDGLWPGKAQWYEQFYGGVDLLADVAAEYSLADPATLDACLAEIETGSCDPSRFRPASCEGALIAKNPRAKGESCLAPAHFLPHRPCLDGLECAGSFDCRVCAEPAAYPRELPEGEVCDAWDACAPGLFCTTTTEPRTCVPLPELGEACEELLCAAGTCHMNLCVPFARVGEPCDLAPCQRDLACEGTTCVPRKLAGESCRRFSSSAADRCAFFCVFDEPDAAEGTCGVPEEAGPVPCALHGTVTDCPAGTYYDTRGQDLDQGGVPEYCMCLPHLPPGADCDLDHVTYRSTGPCKAGYCSEGVCVPVRANGAECSSFVECASEDCDLTTGTCVAACPG